MNEEGGVYEGPTAGEVCCHLTGAEKITSTVSHHLHELESAGLIRIERSGKRMLCTLRPESFESLADDLRLIAKGELRNGGCCSPASTPSASDEAACCSGPAKCC